VGLTMAERKAVTKQVAKRHRRASKAEKGRILDELCALTGWSRRHARRALGQAAEETPERARAARPRTYGRDVLEPLRRIWATLDAPAGKRLAPFMSDIVEAMERWGELEVTPELRAKLLRVSAATIDRLLAPERRRLRVRGRSGTKPGSLLKRQIPIRTFAEWDERVPGFCEVDLVAHDGGDPSGEFCQTLDLTCVATGWTEMRAVPNKAQRWCFEALQEIIRRPPVPAPRPGLRQRIGVHQQPAVRLLPGASDHVHPVQALPQERQLLRRAEELDRRPPTGRLRPVRNAGGARGPAWAVPPPAAVRELLPASDAAGGEDPAGGQGPPAPRPGPDSLPADPRRSADPGGHQGPAPSPVREPQPGGAQTAPRPVPGRAPGGEQAEIPRDQEGGEDITDPPMEDHPVAGEDPSWRTFFVRQRMNLRGHVDVRQLALTGLLRPLALLCSNVSSGHRGPAEWESWPGRTRPVHVGAGQGR
jgi:hypothetical protein